MDIDTAVLHPGHVGAPFVFRGIVCNDTYLAYDISRFLHPGAGADARAAAEAYAAHYRDDDHAWCHEHAPPDRAGDIGAVLKARFLSDAAARGALIRTPPDALMYISPEWRCGDAPYGQALVAVQGMLLEAISHSHE